MPYSETFKHKMVQKMTGPNAASAGALAREVNVAQTTLSRWLRQAPAIDVDFDSNPDHGKRAVSRSPKRPEDWSPEDKMAAVLEASALSEELLGAFLRRKGLHEADVERWKAGMLAGVSGERPDKAKKRERAALNRRVRELEKELSRKDKALAETAALLVLKKKARQIWGDGESDIPRKTEGRSSH
jgi:transposase-like protein